jgi:hypothetical protein
LIDEPLWSWRPDKRPVPARAVLKVAREYLR